MNLSEFLLITNIMIAVADRGVDHGKDFTMMLTLMCTLMFERQLHCFRDDHYNYIPPLIQSAHGVSYILTGCIQSW